jgi:cytochrome c peroxidase
MVLLPMLNHVEMGMNNLSDILTRVQSQPYYKDLFIKAYGTEEINLQKIADALGSFVSAIVAKNSKFDQFNMGLTQLNAIENDGRSLFFNKYNCNSCHQTQMLNGYEMGGGFVNIGLDEVYNDAGLSNVTQVSDDNGKFKIPNLRNIALTGPYMHDGRFSTLEEVLDHYSNGIKNHPVLDPRLKDVNGQAMKMNITDNEKISIIAFLNTLTDHSMLTDPKFSNPFKNY